MTGQSAFLTSIEAALLHTSQAGESDPMPEPDVDVGWMEAIVSSGTLHEPDYALFGKFTDPATTILDIGAHYGYSVGSIWAAGAAACVLSFEPNPLYRAALQRIGQLRPGRHDVRLVALGAAAGEVRMLLPALDGRAVGALCTGMAAADPAALAHAIADHAARHGGERLSLHRFTAPVERLDDQLAAGSFRIPVDRIVAIKMDAEMMEPDILAGAALTLDRHKPLVLIEAGHRSAARAMMQHAGFAMARLDGGRLHPTATPADSVNGWFFHPSRHAEYQALAIF
jgi:FkbM family methyltransferase